MKFSMYLPDAARPDVFAIADEEGHLLLTTREDGGTYSRLITNPAGDQTMLKVRYSPMFGDSFVFSDVTGTRGTYHVKSHRAVEDFHMLTGRYDMQYYRPENKVTIKKQGRVIATALQDPAYECCFQVELTAPTELLFVIGSLLCTAYYL